VSADKAHALFEAAAGDAESAAFRAVRAASDRPG